MVLPAQFPRYRPLSPSSPAQVPLSRISWMKKNCWNGSTYLIYALGMGCLGTFIVNVVSHMTWHMREWGLMPIQKFPPMDIGRIKLEGIVMPNFDNQEGFLSGFKGIAEGLSQSIENFSDSFSNSTSKVIFASGSAMLSLYLLYRGVRTGFNYGEKKLIDSLGRPVLSKTYKMEDRITKMYQGLMSPLTWAYSFFFEKASAKEKPTPIFSPEIEEKMEEMIQSIELISKKEGYFYNALLWGPPGTGKTMSAEYIAEKAGVNFIEISGGDIVKFSGSNQHPVALLDQVFTRMNASDLPTLLFIDELDAIGLDRSRLDPSRVEILNALLNLTGTPSKKIILMAATNRPEDLDSALLSRFSDNWHITPPKEKERLEMLRMYIHYFFEDPEDLKVFSSDLLDKLNFVLEGQTGRSIHALVNKWLLKKNRSTDLALTKEAVLMATHTFLEEQKTLKEVLVNKS